MGDLCYPEGSGFNSVALCPSLTKFSCVDT